MAVGVTRDFSNRE